MRAKTRPIVSVLALAATVVLAPVASARRTTDVAHPAAGAAPKGRPKVVLDQLDLAKTGLGAAEEKYLREVLAREARRADWGAGRTSRIQYRFRVDLLEVTDEGSVVRISCAATGWLPKGKTARSKLSFGGSPKERTELVRRVLAIVARGVVTRLAELERQRRVGR